VDSGYKKLKINYNLVLHSIIFNIKKYVLVWAVKILSMNPNYYFTSKVNYCCLTF